LIKKKLIKIYEYLWKKQAFIKDYILKKKIGAPYIMSMDETLDYILKSHCSVSRYGDGELKLSVGESIRFQKYDDNLSRKLKLILKGNSNSLVCISNIFDDFHWTFEKPYEYTWQVMIKNRKEWTNCLNLDYEYDNSFISRPYFDWKDKKQCSKWFDSLKKIWDGRNIIFIEGNKSRLGYWAIDIGHIDIEYEWFKLGTIDNKYTNEAIGGDIVNSDIDVEFENQIIAEIL